MYFSSSTLNFQLLRCLSYEFGEIDAKYIWYNIPSNWFKDLKQSVRAIRFIIGITKF